ncbi:SAP domain-containing protein [Alkalicella caledoniensis]|uniref:SAP domain-containing protein n=1 Tax=Alkalicella caledoniensis TaxID=2731377 RepID=A0A7G9W3U7_ALKCA|nr:SAP domain-containing protein [Alkalicella caledoniensis]QNO13359.1 SAP domain-containing protein [Alkalicella caledoniensis]
MGLFDLFKKKKDKKVEEINKKKNTDNIGINIKPTISVKTEVVNTPSEPEVIPVEKRIKGMKPNSAGLYPHETLLLSYAPKYYVEGNSYPGFWWYKYGIKDVDKLLQSLLDRGFLQIGSLRSAIEKETATVLKDILKANDLKVSGKKSELVERLLDEVPEEKLKAAFTKFTYELTDEGKDVLNKEEYIPYIHRTGIEDLDIWSLSKKVQEKPEYPYRDVIWGYLNERSMIHAKNGDFGLYRNSRFTMSEFVKEESKLDNAFSLLSEVIRYDLSGLSNGFSMQFMDIYADSYFPYDSSIITMAPGIISRVADYQEKKGLSDEDLKRKLYEEICKFKLPFSVFTEDECVEIVLMEIQKDEEGLQKLYNKAERRFKKEYGIK